MNEFKFTCTVCGQLSDDGDPINAVCMDCDNNMTVVIKKPLSESLREIRIELEALAAKEPQRPGVGAFQVAQMEKTEQIKGKIRTIKEEQPQLTPKDIAHLIGYSESYTRRLINRL